MASGKHTTEARLSELLTTPKRRKFVIAYVENGGNATAAAEVAGLASPAQQGSRLLTDDKIIEAIEVHANIVANVAGESRDTILARIRNRANADPGDYWKTVPLRDREGAPILLNGDAVLHETLKRMDELTKPQRQCIKKITLTNNGTSIEFHDPAAADRDLARLMGLEPKEGEALSPEDAAMLISAALGRMDELDGTASTSK